jgi:hypothetical protein
MTFLVDYVVLLLRRIKKKTLGTELAVKNKSRFVRQIIETKSVICQLDCIKLFVTIKRNHR